jgi:ketosteroid isomerase-like protein
MGELLTDRRLVAYDIRVRELGDVALAEFYWRFDAKFRQDGTPLHTEGRETQVHLRTNGAWRIVHVHYSGMPVTEERQGF